jgi:hypothetical protein
MMLRCVIHIAVAISIDLRVALFLAWNDWLCAWKRIQPTGLCETAKYRNVGLPNYLNGTAASAPQALDPIQLQASISNDNLCISVFDETSLGSYFITLGLAAFWNLVAGHR